MWINVKGFVLRINAAVFVKLLTDRQRSELAIRPLVRKITYGHVLEIDVLKKKKEEA